MRTGLIGLGGMGKRVVSELQSRASDTSMEIVGAIVAPEDLQQARQNNKLDVPLLDDFEALMSRQPDVIAECAGHEAVKQYAEKVLAASIDGKANSDLVNQLAAEL